MNRKWVILSPVLLLFFGCELFNHEESDNIVIEYPLNKTAVFLSAGFANTMKDSSCVPASQFLIEPNDSLFLFGMSILSITIDSIFESGTSKIYDCTVNKFVPKETSNYEENRIISGKLTIEIDKNWILYQYDEIGDAHQALFKFNTDTTDIPSTNYEQFPVLPKKIEPGQIYKVVRPKSDEGYGTVERYFKVEDYMDFTDYFCTDKGVYVEIDQLNIGYPGELHFNMIVDKYGMVISQYKSYDAEYTDDVLTNIYATNYIIHRRIVNFTDSNQINELSYYSNLVLQNGVKFLEK